MQTKSIDRRRRRSGRNPAGPTIGDGAVAASTIYNTGQPLVVDMSAEGVAGTDFYTVSPLGETYSLNRNHMLYSDDYSATGAMVLGGGSGDTIQQNIWPLPPGDFTVTLHNAAYTISRGSGDFRVEDPAGAYVYGPSFTDLTTHVWVELGTIATDVNIPVGWREFTFTGDKIVITPDAAVNPNLDADRLLVSNALTPADKDSTGTMSLGKEGGSLSSDTFSSYASSWPLGAGDYKIWLTDSGVGVRCQGTFTVTA